MTGDDDEGGPLWIGFETTSGALQVCRCSTTTATDVRMALDCRQDVLRTCGPFRAATPGQAIDLASLQLR